MTSEERELREKIDGGSPDVDDYRKLAHLLHNAGQAEECVRVLEQVLQLHPPAGERAKLLMQLGWSRYELSGQTEKALSYAEQALQLLHLEVDTDDVLLIRSLTDSLVAHCTWNTDRAGATQAAERALASLTRLMESSHELDETRYLAYFEAGKLHQLVGHLDAATECCEH